MLRSRRWRKYALLQTMHIEYAVLHALEAGYATVREINVYLNGPVRGRVFANSAPVDLVKSTQITAALQRLKRDKMVINDAHEWARIGVAA